MRKGVLADPSGGLIRSSVNFTDFQLTEVMQVDWPARGGRR